MSLHLHRSERADALAGELAGLLSTPLADPFVAEVVAVPTRGVERWLAQSLASRLGATQSRADGVCATVDFPSPYRLMSVALDGVTGRDGRDDPWRPDRLTWPVLAAVEAGRDQAWAAVLWSFLEGRHAAGDAVRQAHRDPMDPGGPVTAARPERRWSTAAHIAELFARYAVQRPGMIDAWREGRDVGPDGSPLPEPMRWQPELWRRVRDAVDDPDPALRLPAACVALAEDPATTALPKRLSVFGLTRLEPDLLAVLSALAGHRDVHLWLTHPSPVLWSTVASAIQTGRTPAQSAATGIGRTGPRRHDPTATLPRHRLLAYLGRDIRELQVRLSTGPAPAEDASVPGLPPLAGVPTLLQRLQHDVSTDQPARIVAERPVLARHDRSVQVHICHGPDRQVEVLREVLLGLLDDDPTLEPRDIVVLCPDIETFAPLIAASFGLDTGAADSAPADGKTSPGPVDHPGHRLRVRLADRSLRRVNPLLSVLDRVLELIDSRLPASAVLDLAAMPPVARRFGLGDDDQQRMAELVTAAGVRWGLDGPHRARYGLGDFGQNTWAAGLDRMLLGVTMDATGEYFIGTALPLDEVDSGDVDLVGRIAELVARLNGFGAQIGTTGALAGGAGSDRRPLGWWMALCREILEALTAVTSSDAWQSTHAFGELARINDQAGSDGTDAGAGLSLSDVRSLLADAFKGRATRANFRTGTLTMCTMLPMRSVPHRVVCLLGIDDTTFPRHRVVDGDDLLVRDPWVGDRDPRSEDRQLLLDALMAAEERLVIVYSGIDARTGVTKPVSVPIGELLDALEETARTDDGTPLRQAISSRHTLQPFDRDNFVHPDGGLPFSFDIPAMRGAAAAAAPRQQPPNPFDLAGLRPLEPVTDVGLDDLVRFFQHPARALLRARAQMYLGEDEAEPIEQIPIAPSGLDTWSIGNRLLQRHLEGVPLGQLVGAEWRRGSLPPRELGAKTLRPIGDDVAALAAAAQPYLGGEHRSRDVDVRLDERSITGTVPVQGERIVTVLYSWLAARHRLQAWLQLLALTATDPMIAWQAVTIGRGRRSVIGPVGDRFARLVLADLLTLYDLGRNEPLPFAPKTSAEYARVRLEDKSVAALHGAIERQWRGDQKRVGERDADYARFFPESLADLLAPRARPGDAKGPLGEPSRFGSIARRIWQPLLMSEELTR
ncbi:MAG TPA: exodeoxyribonuclease V subunit gamma [Microlunatus sp.]|nr:exodeoxyribonuclease V subunit gamma [Microlunatus sp.]